MSKSLFLSLLGTTFVLATGLAGCTVPVRTVDTREFPIRPNTDSLRVLSPWRSMNAIQPNTYSVYRTSRPILIDGVPNEAAWAEASFSNEFVDIEGVTRPDPTQRTRFKMLWDSTYLYIAGFIEERDLWATITKQNEVIFHDHDFEVFLDPDGDHHNYHEMEFNALNTRWELTLRRPYRDGGPYIDPDNINGLRSAVHLDGTLNDAADTDVGWTIEIALPWNRLRQFDAPHLPPRPDDRWRINFSRVQWDLEPQAGGYRKIEGRKEHNWVWSPIGIVDIHRPERWGWIRFVSRASVPGPSVDQTPRDGQNRIRSPSLVEEMGIRDTLMKIYYLAATFHSLTGQYPKRLADLFGSDIGLTTSFEYESSPGGYIVQSPETVGGRRNRMYLNHTGRIWKSRAHE